MRLIIAALVLFASPALAQTPTAQTPTPIPYFDPSRNVLDKVGDAIKRLDDLRDVDRQLNEIRTSSLKENVALRAEYEDKLRRAEASRLDAIRLVDTTTLSIDRERTTATAQTLQKKVDDSALVLSANAQKNADDLVKLVKTTADEQSRNLQQQFTGIQSQFSELGKRLTMLEQTGAEGVGKQKYQDPALAALLAKVESLAVARTAQEGVGLGRGEVIGWIVAGIGILIAVFMAFMAYNKKPT